MGNFASVVVSAYNRLELLQRSLESLWENTDYPYELIVHDDGSREDTSTYLCELVQQGKISTLILNPPDHNRGLGTSVNRAVYVSEGEYIVKVNGDDEFEPGWLFKAIQVLQTYPEIGLLHLASYDYCAIHNSRCPDDQWEPGLEHITLCRMNRCGIPIRIVWAGPGDGIMFTRETWQRVGPWLHGYNPSFGEDVPFRLTCCPMMRLPNLREGYYLSSLKSSQLKEHWEEYKGTPWLALIEPAVINFSMGNGLTIISEAQKTLKHGPLVLGRV